MLIFDFLFICVVSIGMDYPFLQAFSVLPCFLFPLFFVIFRKPFHRKCFNTLSIICDCFSVFGSILFFVVLVNPQSESKQFLTTETENYFSIIIISCFCFVLVLQATLVLWYNLRTLFFLLRFKLKSKSAKEQYLNKATDTLQNSKDKKRISWCSDFVKENSMKFFQKKKNLKD